MDKSPKQKAWDFICSKNPYWNLVDEDIILQGIDIAIEAQKEG